jgi:hypothetical protein
MIYVKAGLYAEGPSDYRFLLPVITRLLHEVAPRALPSLPEIADTEGIDAPRTAAPNNRAERIAAAVHDYWGTCTIFVVHGDANGDHVRALAERVQPWIDLALQQHPDAAIVPCVPVRAVEAWMLGDPEVFKKLLGGSREPNLPPTPETLADPKAIVNAILTDLGANLRALRDFQAFFGANVDFRPLRRQPSFRDFEQALGEAVARLAPR